MELCTAGIEDVCAKYAKFTRSPLLKEEAWHAPIDAAVFTRRRKLTGYRWKKP